MIKTIVLLIIAYVLNLIDFFQTTHAISHFGLGVEANPVVRFFFQIGCAEVVKLIIPIILLVALGYIVKLDKRNMWAVYFIVIFYTLLVLHNFAVLAVLF